METIDYNEFINHITKIQNDFFKEIKNTNSGGLSVVVKSVDFMNFLYYFLTKNPTLLLPFPDEISDFIYFAWFNKFFDENEDICNDKFTKEEKKLATHYLEQVSLQLLQKILVDLLKNKLQIDDSTINRLNSLKEKFNELMPDEIKSILMLIKHAKLACIEFDEKMAANKKELH